MKTNNFINGLLRPSSHHLHNSTPEQMQTYVHPCVIDQQPHIVYPRGLQQDAPDVFRQLSQYFSNMGYRLKEDQRDKSQTDSQHPRRRKWAPIILFTAGLLFESTANADVEITIDNQSVDSLHNIELSLISNKSILSDIRSQINYTSTDTKRTLQANSVAANEIYTLLNSRYQRGHGDPLYIPDDLRKMADYYSQYPEVISLLQAIKNKNWSLKFDLNNWTTIASGNAFEIEKAEVHINTRSAAQLRLNDSCKENPICIASPADALLHELLHVHAMFNESKTFITHGGMNQVLYPYQHERHIIKQERELYKKMSATDGIKRPYRHSHAGRIVKANCSTCIK